MMPTAPMTLPSAGALRSGRNTSRWASRPMKQAIRSASTAAGKSPMLSPRLTVTGMFGLWPGMMSTHGKTRSPFLVSSSYTYTVYMAKAPWAKLMTPEPLNAVTRPVASMA